MNTSKNRRGFKFNFSQVLDVKVLITGGANGIGKATAEKLSQWHEVTVFDKDREALEDPDDSIRTIEGDVRAPEEVEEAVSEDLDVLINCAGYYELAAVEDQEFEALEKMVETNFYGYFHTMKAAIPVLKQNGGRIVNISSIAGKSSFPFYGGYSASKHAVEALTDSARIELHDTDINVVLVEPGPVETGFNRRARKALEKYIPESVYSELYREIAERETQGEDAEETVETVVKAVETSRPKTRYLSGRKAWLTATLEFLLPISALDRIKRKVFY